MASRLESGDECVRHQPEPWLDAKGGVYGCAAAVWVSVDERERRANAPHNAKFGWRRAYGPPGAVVVGGVSAAGGGGGGGAGAGGDGGTGQP